MQLAKLAFDKSQTTINLQARPYQETWFHCNEHTRGFVISSYHGIGSDTRQVVFNPVALIPTLELAGIDQEPHWVNGK